MQAPAAHRRLASGREAVDGGWRPTARRSRKLDDAFEVALERVARIPINQLVMHKLLVNQALYAQGLHATQTLGTFFDGITRHTPEATGVLTVHIGPKQIVAGLSVEFEDHVLAPQIEACVQRIETALKKANPDIVTLFIKPQTTGTWEARQKKLGAA